jgi:hypothetical protein
MSLGGLGIVIGEILCMGVLFRITKTMDPKYAFGLAGLSGVFLTFFLLFMIKEPDAEDVQPVIITKNPIIS